jgi:glycosyltransferase involved in cell wall biosynthesis
MTLVSKNLISALIITYNEEANIARTLQALEWMPFILIVDSGSTDQTIKIANEFKNTKVIYREFDTFSKQCNFGLSILTSDWILSLDADYVLSGAVSDEIINVVLSQPNDFPYRSFRIKFWYCINGKPIRSGILPPRTCLYQREGAEYIDIGHGHRVIIAGRVGDLKNRIFHDDRKPLKIWLESQQKYQLSEATMLKSSKSNQLPIQDLIRKHTFLAPFLAFIVCILFKKGFLDGKAGLLYAYQRLIAESILYNYLHSTTALEHD